jgi:hypothetical protein
MEKIDLTRKYKSYYTAQPTPAFVQIEKAEFLSVAGKGDPAAAAFAELIQALYATAYTIKFYCKAQSKDFVVAKLEGLWWFDEQAYSGFTMDEAPVKIPRSDWEYRLLIRMPDFVNQAMVNTAIEKVVAEKGIAMAQKIDLFEMTEGKCVQMLHKGPFDKEPESLKQMAAFMEKHQLQKNGLHHEIYLSDFRKTAQDKLKTILREPVK